MLDKKQIWSTFLLEFKMGCKAAETTCNINNAFGPGTANKHTVQWWVKKLCKGNESLEVEEGSSRPSEFDNDQLRGIIEADPLITTQEVAEKLNVNHPMVVWHLKQIGKVKKSFSWVLCLIQFSSVQSLSRVQLFATPWITACQASLSITNSQSLLKRMSIESVRPSCHIILCHPLLLLPPIPPSIRVFSNESTLRVRWPKYWSFSFSISPSNEHPGLISFRMDWLDLPAVQGTLKSLLQHHSSKASVFWLSAFFTVQLSHP